MKKSLPLLLGVWSMLMAFPALSPGQNPVDIQINFTGDSAYESFFTSAEARWESILTGWKDGTNVTIFSGNTDYSNGDDLTTIYIDAQASFIDGAGGILGSAGPNQFVDDGTYILATRGSMTFDSADLASLGSALEDVILHEMAHVLGIGTLWTNNGLYTNGSGQYTGANALREYRDEFDTSATFVPVELDGGSGTANGHWDEGNITVIDPTSPNFGRTRSGALMTGFLDTADPYISETTGGSFEDLGYNVDYNAIRGVPEPGAVSFLAVTGIACLLRRRRS